MITFLYRICKSAPITATRIDSALARTYQSRRLLIANDDKESTHNYLNWLQKQKDQEELKRLLYVGVTRAKVRRFDRSIETADDEGAADGVSGSLWRLLLTSKTASHIMQPIHRHISPLRVRKNAERFSRYRLALDAQNQPVTDDTPANLIDSVQSPVWALAIAGSASSA